MKKIILAFGAAAMFSVATAYAQAPAPRADSVRDPIKQGDPAPDNVPTQAAYTKDMVRINSKDIPASLRKHYQKILIKDGRRLICIKINPVTAICSNSRIHSRPDYIVSTKTGNL
jgi:hypothetical protein